MAIQTKITAISNNLEYGTTGIALGSATGDNRRTVILYADPNPGYKFDGWDIVSTPVTLKVSAYPNVIFGGRDVSNVCYSGRVAEVGAVLYTDDVSLYEDGDGLTLARNGYWVLGSDQYIVIQQGKVIASAKCDGGGGGGGGGDGGGDGDDVSI